MYSVKRTSTGGFYTTNQFLNMTAIEREHLKGDLECRGCGGKAYFRRARSDGRGACFCANHIGECDEKSKKREVVEPDNLTAAQKLKARDDQYGLKKKNYLKNIWLNDDDNDQKPDEDFENKGPSKRKYVFDPEINIRTHMTLPKILQVCIDKNLHLQNYEIEISEGKHQHIRECVHELNHVTDKELNKLAHYWGYIICAQENWLNTNKHYAPNPSFFLSEEMKSEFWESVRLEPKQWDKAIPMIVKGKLEKSHKNKYYVKVTSFDSIYLNTKMFKNAFKSKVQEL